MVNWKMEEFLNLPQLLIKVINARGLDQAEFADEVDVSDTTVSRWIRGERLIDDKLELKVAKALNIPYQVIKNLNSRMPKRIYYDIEHRTYSNSRLAQTIFDYGIDFRDQHPTQGEVFKTFVSGSDFEVVSEIKKSRVKSEMLNRAILSRASQLLPELNFEVSAENEIVGHSVFLPLKFESYQRIIDSKMSESDIKSTDLDFVNNRGDLMIFFFYSLYADNNDHAYFVMNRIFNYFFSKRIKNYAVAGMLYDQESIQFFKQFNLNEVWIEEYEDTSKPKLKCLVQGHFDDYLFKD